MTDQRYNLSQLFKAAFGINSPVYVIDPIGKESKSAISYEGIQILPDYYEAESKSWMGTPIIFAATLKGDSYQQYNSTGEIEEVGYEPDFAVRHKYLDSAYKLKGVYVPEEKDKPKDKENSEPIVKPSLQVEPLRSFKKKDDKGIDIPDDMLDPMGIRERSLPKSKIKSNEDNDEIFIIADCKKCKREKSCKEGGAIGVVNDDDILECNMFEPKK